VKEQIRMTADLNTETKALRVFFGWPGCTAVPGGGSRYDIAQNTWSFLHREFPEEQIWDWCREGLTEAARLAGDFGVTLALQNHRPVLKTYHDVIRMVKEVGSPHLKICLDASIMEKTDPAYLRQAVLDVGSLQIHSHYGGEYKRMDPDGPILPRKVTGSWGGDYVHGDYEPKDNIYLPFFKAMLENGYRGYVGYELCHPLPVVDGQLAGIDFVDATTRLGLEYIKNTIAEAKQQVISELRGNPRIASAQGSGGITG
jgi:sugar phosphate isomerase/epimerase